MGLIRLPRQIRYAQPQGAAQIDPAIGADFGWLASAGVIVGPAISSSTATKRVTKAGVGISSGYSVVSGKIPSLHTTTWTECGVVLLDGVNDVYTLSAQATGQAVSFRPGSSTVDLVIWGVADVNLSFGTLPTGIVQYVARRVGTNYAVWLNGVLYGVTASGGTPNPYDGTLPAVGAFAGSGGNVGNTPLTSTTGSLAVVRTPLALTDAYCKALSENHWQAFKSPLRVMMLTASGGPTYTLAAATAAIPIAGAAAGLKASRKITAASSAIALGGSAASLLAGRKLAAQSGAVALIGNAASLTVARRLTANTGSLGISGAAAGLLFARRLGAASGSVPIAAGAAGLRAARVLPASSGAVAITGRAANLVYTPFTAGSYTLSAGSGAIPISGGSASLIVARKLVASSGALAIVGQAAGLKCARRLVTNTGVMGITCGSAGLRANRRLVLSSAALALVVSNAGLLRGGMILPNPHQTYTGQPRNRVHVGQQRIRTYIGR